MGKKIFFLASILLGFSPACTMVGASKASGTDLLQLQAVEEARAALMQYSKDRGREWIISTPADSFLLKEYDNPDIFCAHALLGSAKHACTNKDSKLSLFEYDLQKLNTLLGTNYIIAPERITPIMQTSSEDQALALLMLNKLTYAPCEQFINEDTDDSDDDENLSDTQKTTKSHDVDTCIRCQENRRQRLLQEIAAGTIRRPYADIQTLAQAMLEGKDPILNELLARPASASPSSSLDESGRYLSESSSDDDSDSSIPSSSDSSQSDDGDSNEEDDLSDDDDDDGDGSIAQRISAIKKYQDQHQAKSSDPAAFSSYIEQMIILETTGGGHQTPTGMTSDKKPLFNSAFEQKYLARHTALQAKITELSGAKKSADPAHQDIIQSIATETATLIEFRNLCHVDDQQHDAENAALQKAYLSLVQRYAEEVLGKTESDYDAYPYCTRVEALNDDEKRIVAEKISHLASAQEIMKQLNITPKKPEQAPEKSSATPSDPTTTSAQNNDTTQTLEELRPITQSQSAPQDPTPKPHTDNPALSDQSSPNRSPQKSRQPSDVPQPTNPAQSSSSTSNPRPPQSSVQPQNSTSWLRYALRAGYIGGGITLGKIYYDIYTEQRTVVRTENPELDDAACSARARSDAWKLFCAMPKVRALGTATALGSVTDLALLLM